MVERMRENVLDIILLIRPTFAVRHISVASDKHGGSTGSDSTCRRRGW